MYEEDEDINSGPACIPPKDRGKSVASRCVAWTRDRNDKVKIMGKKAAEGGREMNCDRGRCMKRITMRGAALRRLNRRFANRNLARR